MTVQKTYMGTKNPAAIDPNKAEFPLSFGIYKGVVKQLDVTSRSGRVFVYIPSFGTDDPDSPLGWQTVSYASPFGGTTQGQDPAGVPSQENSFKFTRQSYGWFTTPPDVGSIILCCFPDGVRFEGFWFACVNSDLSRHMTPAIGSLPLNLIEANSVPSTIQPLLRPNSSYPVSEFNENDKKVFTSNWTNNLRPLHIPQTENLLRQGLDEDSARGAITSSMQRDPISTVYGLSTPGRPYQEQDPANNPNLAEKLRTGDFNPNDWNVTTRVGGHSLVLDDGNIFNKNNLVRLRTSAGHQILMNDSEGFLYISTASGKNWIELTEDGKMLIYAAGDLSVRTEGDFNVHSDQNINLYAENKVNIGAASTLALEAATVTGKASNTLNLVGQNAQIKGTNALGLFSDSIINQKSGAKINIDSAAIDLNSGTAGGELGDPLNLPKITSPDTVNVNGKWENISTLSSIFGEVPCHEPYVRSPATIPATPPINATAPVTPGSNVENAKKQAFNSQSAADCYVKQPLASGPIGNLDVFEVTALFAQIGYNESRCSYNAENQFGYLGKYQMGTAALSDGGYVVRGTKQSRANVANPNVWRGKNGINTKENFLANGIEQENNMYGYTVRNYNTLVRIGVISDRTSKEDVAGYLASAHLLGPGTVKKWVTGGEANFADANGTTITKYFNAGRYSQTQVPTVIASKGSTVAVG